jgi:hypothetical protein
MRTSQTRLVAQLGYPITSDAPVWYSAVRFQPAMIGLIILAGTVLHSPAVFVMLFLALVVGAVAPRGNPFDAIFNGFLLRGRGRPLPPAPAPRRFAQGLASLISIGIALALFFEVSVLPWVLQGLFALAVIAVVFGDSCAGAVVYHKLAARVRGGRLQAAH